MSKALELKKMLSTLDPDRLTREDFVAAFERVVDFLKRQEQQYQTLLSDMLSAKSRMEQKLAQDTHATAKDLTQEVSSALKALTQRIDTRLHSLKDGKDGHNADEHAIFEKVMATIVLPEQKPLVSESPQEIRDKLELLQGEERLDVSAIRGLEEKIEKVRGENKTTLVPIGGPSAGKIVKYHDLSASLNGSTTTFALPAFYRVVSVHSSSFPFILRPTTDYTVDGSTMQITFTSEIDPATTLASGQSLIIVYAEA